MQHDFQKGISREILWTLICHSQRMTHVVVFNQFHYTMFNISLFMGGGSAFLFLGDHKSFWIFLGI